VDVLAGTTDDALNGATEDRDVLIDHVEINIARGTLTDDYCAQLDQLLCDVLGWHGQTNTFVHPLDRVERRERVYGLDNGQSVVLNEADECHGTGTDDHFGILVSSDRLDRIFEQCQQLQRRDDRLALRYVIDDQPSSVDLGDRELRAIFVQYLIPRWIDIQSRDAKP
jgi:hypothetical protein